MTGSPLESPSLLTSSKPGMRTTYPQPFADSLRLDDFFSLKSYMWGLSWRSSDQDSTFQCRRCRFEPSSGSWDPMCRKAKKPKHKKQKQYCNKFNKDFLKIICVHLGRGKEACFEGCTCINGLGPSMADDATTLLA